MFTRGEEVINLDLNLAGLVQADERDGMVSVKWYMPGVGTTEVPANKLMNSTDHLMMQRAKAIDQYKPALRALAKRWSNRPQSER